MAALVEGGAESGPLPTLRTAGDVPDRLKRRAVANPAKWMGKARAGMKRRSTTGSLRKQDPTPKDKGLSEADLHSLWAKAQRSNDTALKRKVVFAANARKPPVKLAKSKEK